MTDYTPAMIEQLRGRRQKQVVQARIDGLSIAETAKALGCSHIAVKTALYSARRFLGLPGSANHRKAGPPPSYSNEFTRDQLPLFSPRVRQAVELALEGKNEAQIAVAMGVTRGAIRSLIGSAKFKRGRKGDEAAKVSKALVGPRPDLPRCRCGLLLPCNDCIGPVTAYMWSGRGNSPFEGERRVR